MRRRYGIVSNAHFSLKIKRKTSRSSSINGATVETVLRLAHTLGVTVEDLATID